MSWYQQLHIIVLNDINLRLVQQVVSDVLYENGFTLVVTASLMR